MTPAQLNLLLKAHQSLSATGNSFMKPKQIDRTLQIFINQNSNEPPIQLLTFFLRKVPLLNP
mgnify:CR=1 FL=1